MSPTGELIDTETVTISSEGGGWKRTQPVIRKDIRTPAQAVPRQPPTLLHVQFLGEGVAATSPPYPTPGWATTQVYPARITRHRITRTPDYARKDEPTPDYARGSRPAHRGGTSVPTIFD